MAHGRFPCVGAGIDRILVLTRGVGVDLKDDNQVRIAEDVLPLLRS